MTAFSHSDLDVLMQEVRDHETAVHCAQMAIYQPTPASHHLTNALAELATLAQRAPATGDLSEKTTSSANRSPASDVAVSP